MKITSLEWACLNPIQDGIFGAAHGLGGGKKIALPKICPTYPTMMKLDTVTLYLNKIQKTYKSRDTHLQFYRLQHFFTSNQQLLLCQEIQI